MVTLYLLDLRPACSVGDGSGRSRRRISRCRPATGRTACPTRTWPSRFPPRSGAVRLPRTCMPVHGGDDVAQRVLVIVLNHLGHTRRARSEVQQHRIGIFRQTAGRELARGLCGQLVEVQIAGLAAVNHYLLFNRGAVGHCGVDVVGDLAVRGGRLSSLRPRCCSGKRCLWPEAGW